MINFKYFSRFLSMFNRMTLLFVVSLFCSRESCLVCYITFVMKCELSVCSSKLSRCNVFIHPPSEYALGGE